MDNEENEKKNKGIFENKKKAEKDKMMVGKLADHLMKDQTKMIKTQIYLCQQSRI
jgi:capsule polysaccharide export protein KpsE/RkpR